MKKTNKTKEFLDWIGLITIGLFSLGYVLFYSFFAEKHIQLPFLDFPIFVGEILLFICLSLFFIKYFNNLPKLTKWHYLIIGYFIFVFGKALYGYVNHGPLALRDSALLYYPSFVVFGYVFYRSKFFNAKVASLLVFSIIAIFIHRDFYGYWLLTLTFFGIILIKSFSNRWLKILMFLLLFSCVPYKWFFETSRMMIVSNFVSGIYLVMMLFFIVKGSRKVKCVVAVIAVICIFFGMFKYANHKALKSIVDFKRMSELIKSSDEVIKEGMKDYKEGKEIKAQLYNPNTRSVDIQKEEVLPEKEKDFSENEIKEKIRNVFLGAGKEDVVIVFNKKIERKNIAEVENVDDVVIKQDSVFNGSIEKEMKDYKEGKEEIKAQLYNPNTRSADIQKEEILSETEKDFFENEIKEKTRHVVLSAGKEDVAMVINKKIEGKNIAEVENADDVIIKQDSVFNGSIEKEKKEYSVDQIKKEVRQILFDADRKDVEVFIKVVNAGEKKEEIVEEGVESVKGKDLPYFNDNATFRILIWRDMLVELAKKKPIFGFDFGKPLRSKSLEILHWGDGDWARDGWIAPHNSYLHMIYRAGIIGVIVILSFLTILFRMIKRFIKLKSLTGILLCGIIINWFVAANFLLIFELPYTAIPIWTIYGITFAYYCKIKEKIVGI